MPDSSFRRRVARAVDADPATLPTMDPLQPHERRGLRFAVLSIFISVVALVVSAYPETSAWRGTDGSLTHSSASLMQSIVGLILLLFLIL